jgi:hypothetical protein
MLYACCQMPWRLLHACNLPAFGMQSSATGACASPSCTVLEMIQWGMRQQPNDGAQFSRWVLCTIVCTPRVGCHMHVVAWHDNM